MEIVDHSPEVIEEMKRKLEAGLAALGETAAARAATRQLARPSP